MRASEEFVAIAFVAWPSVLLCFFESRTENRLTRWYHPSFCPLLLIQSCAEEFDEPSWLSGQMSLASATKTFPASCRFGASLSQIGLCLEARRINEPGKSTDALPVAFCWLGVPMFVCLVLCSAYRCKKEPTFASFCVQHTGARKNGRTILCGLAVNAFPYQ